MKVGDVITLFVGGFLFAILVPGIVLPLIYGTTVTTWSATQQTMWYLIPLLIVVAGMLGFIQYLRGR